MTAPRVVNKKDAQNGDVYVGRPTKWGNPYVLHRDGNRKQVIRKYKQHLLSRQDLLDALPELRGKNLVCWCAPKRCHADVLLKMANA